MASRKARRDAPQVPAASGYVTYRRLLGYTARYWYMLLAAIAGFTVFAAMQGLTAKLAGMVIDAIGKQQTDLASWVPAVIVGLAVVRGLGSFVGDYGIAYVARNIVYTLRCEMFDRMISLPTAFYAQQTTGRLVTMLTYDVDQVTIAATGAIKVLVKEGLTVVALLGLLLWYNWKLTLIMLVVMPLVGRLVQAATRRFRQYSKRLQSSVGQVTHVASEAVNGAQVVKVFGGQGYEQQRFRKVSAFNLKQGLKIASTRAANTPIVQLVLSIPVAIIMYLALQPGIMGSMSTADMVTYLGALALMVAPIKALTEINEKVQRGIAASQSIFELIDTPAEPPGGNHDPGRVRGEVEFRNVVFRYPGAEDDVLRGISFRAAPGETVALVGRSGGGKTTMVSLLARFFDVDAGQILIDGVPLAEFRLAALRRQISLVNQRITLFDDSVAANIAYGEMAGASRGAIVAAATDANAVEFIEKLPEGFDTRVGHDGAQLSGGQRQRVAIARALLKDAPILILDEATSALDTESEFHIQGALERLMAHRTTFVIAHRLSTVERADRILVIDDGRIVEQGTHAELLALEGHYARLYRRRFDEDAVE